ncbi:MAG: YciK family oxidoreductase [Pseudohongiella sp.]|nr:YciK family oxidoreductase [Pseudohongiella sp.]MDO9519576.1 YciK family oxidoreductase [Pseudohongiella sp.]MDP2127416.1 YciK family oxidoreductase [Pseudohongiella sp.]
MSDLSSATKSLTDRIILITGAGDGIGRAVALASAREGATVILLGRTQEKLEKVYDLIVAENLPEPIIHPMDLATATNEEYELLGRSIDEQFGRLDGLLHNASVLGLLGPVQYFAPESLMKIMQVNVNAAFLMTRALLPALLKSDSGRVLFTSSSVGRAGRAYWGAYSVSKFATEGLMQVLADELANTSAIRVNSINPGATRTEMRAAAYPAENPNTLPTPESLTPVYIYLLGKGSQHLHGQALDIRKMLTELPPTI